MNQVRAAMLGTMLGLGALGLGPVVAQEGKPAAPPQQEQAPSFERLIRELGDGSFRTRLRAENELRAAGESALPDLKRAAEQNDDPEVQWRARRLVRQIERGDVRGLVQRGRDDRDGLPQGRGPDNVDIERQFDALFRQMEQRLGIDIPRASFFHDDFFRDLQAQVQDGATRSQGLSMEVGPDGHVRVEVRETDADGKEETKVYEAPDMDTFRAQYPGVLQRGGLGFGGLDLRLWSEGHGPRNPFFPLPRGLQPLQPDQESDVEVDRGAEVDQQVGNGQRLGVAVHAHLPAELREHLGLAEGIGLMVQAVTPDSLASSLDLQAGDIVTHIGSHTIGSPGDVQEALGALEAGAEVEVSFLRKGAEQKARATKPAAKDDDAAAPGKGLRRRSGGDAAKVR